MSANYDPSSFKPGEMDISVQQQTYAGFIKACTVITVAVIAILIFLLIVAV